VQHSRRLAEALPDAELVELPGVGHVAMLERPDVVTALLDGFARRVLGGSSGYGDTGGREQVIR
jgi:pimeloyl-ACP methyl ester carboxylesterase